MDVKAQQIKVLFKGKGMEDHLYFLYLLQVRKYKNGANIALYALRQLFSGTSMEMGLKNL